MELPGDAFSAPSCHPFYALLGAGHRYEGSKDATNEAPGQYYELPVGLEPKMDRFFRCLRVKKDPEPTSVRVRFGFAVSNGFVSHSWRTSSSRVPRVPRRFHGDSPGRGPSGPSPSPNEEPQMSGPGSDSEMRVFRRPSKFMVPFPLHDEFRGPFLSIRPSELEGFDPAQIAGVWTLKHLRSEIQGS